MASLQTHRGCCPNAVSYWTVLMVLCQSTIRECGGTISEVIISVVSIRCNHRRLLPGLVGLVDQGQVVIFMDFKVRARLSTRRCLPTLLQDDNLIQDFAIRTHPPFFVTGTVKMQKLSAIDLLHASTSLIWLLFLLPCGLAIALRTRVFTSLRASRVQLLRKNVAIIR